MKLTMNKIYRLLLILVVVSFGFTSCDDEDFTGHSSLVPTSPTISISAPSSITIDEQDTTFSWTVTMSEAQIVDVAIYVTVAEGTTATEHDDFDIENSNSRVYIPAGSTTGTAMVTLYADDDTREETEMLMIQIGDSRTANASITPTTVAITINNTPDFAPLETVTLTAVWDNGDETAVGESFCSSFDVDVLFLVEDFSGYHPDFSMATGSCPEVGDLDWADGHYWVTTNLYGSVDLGEFATDIPVSLQLTRYNNDGSVASSSTVLIDEQLHSDDDGSSLYLVGYITVTNGVYELFGADDTSYGDVSVQKMDLPAGVK